jgi:hypothetical protein
LKNDHVQINLPAIHRANQAVPIHREEEKICLHEVVLYQGPVLLAKQETAQIRAEQDLRRWSGNSQDCGHVFSNLIFLKM